MEDERNSYRIKDIKFFGSPRQILLQSANGPCPLLAICNVLLLRSQLKLPHDVRYVSFEDLVQRVSNLLFDSNTAATSGDQSTSSRDANVRENLTSCLEVLPTLNVGLDVNCKFGGPKEFEYTKELAVFDLLDIGLFHGWVVSEQDKHAYATFAHLSYNQVVEKLIALEEAQQSVVTHSGQTAAGKVVASDTGAADREAETAGACCSADEGGVGSGALVPIDGVPASGSVGSAPPRPCSPTSDPAIRKAIDEGMIIKDFLDRTASQLSYEGLLAVHEVVRERELAVFFRNSHFSAMLKYSGELYLLCTDISFGASHIVWERLDEVNGDTSYCDADFLVNTAGSDEAAAQAAAEALQDGTYAAAAAGGGPESSQTDMDAMLAWQLTQEDLQAQQQASVDSQLPATTGPRPPVVQGRIVSAGPGGGAPGVNTRSAAQPPQPAGGAGAGAAAPPQPPPKGKKRNEKKEKSGKSCVVQ